MPTTNAPTSTSGRESKGATKRLVHCYEQEPTGEPLQIRSGNGNGGELLRALDTRAEQMPHFPRSKTAETTHTKTPLPLLS